MIANGVDVVAFLKEQHNEVKTLLEAVSNARGPARAKAFFNLRRTLAVHETAEEEIVHPAARRALPNGAEVVDARLREENAAKIALTKLEKLEVDSPEFEKGFQALKSDVLAHAESEEREEFDRLADKLEPARLERMRRAVELAESVAPTRPHPGLESPAANIFAGPFESMLDRTRDALSGKGH
jgi:hemerythrin superfamily protein